MYLLYPLSMYSYLYIVHIYCYLYYVESIVSIYVECFNVYRTCSTRACDVRLDLYGDRSTNKADARWQESCRSDRNYTKHLGIIILSNFIKPVQILLTKYQNSNRCGWFREDTVNVNVNSFGKFVMQHSVLKSLQMRSSLFIHI